MTDRRETGEGEAPLSNRPVQVLIDGWWSEAWDKTNGWAIQSEPGPDTTVQDARGADRLYGLLEREVVPAFYGRDERGLPRAWLSRVRASLMSLGPRFCAARMLRDYLSRVYGVAAEPVDHPAGRET
jgi:starch phosphorylase